MKFYATVAASSTSPKGNETVERIEKRVLDSNPVMEAFGKALFYVNSKGKQNHDYIVSLCVFNFYTNLHYSPLLLF